MSRWNARSASGARSNELGARRCIRFRTQVGAQDDVGIDFVRSEALPQPDAKVAVIGHSQVQRLSRLNFGPIGYQGADNLRKTYRITFFSESGATIHSLRTSTAWDRCVLLRPDITFFFIGGNDIVPGRRPITYVEDLIQLVQDYERIVGGIIKIFPIEVRTQPRGISAEEYQIIVRAVNTKLRYNVATKHMFVNVPFLASDIGTDGVHITGQAAIMKYRWIVRMASKHLQRDLEGVVVFPPWLNM